MDTPIHQLAHAAQLVTTAAAALAEGPLAAGHAAYAAWLVEELSMALTRAQLYAADAIRRTGAHKLDQASLQAIAEAGLTPTDADLAATAGHTSTGRTHYKKSLDLLADWMNIPLSTARGRLAQVDNLIAQVNEAGERTAPRLTELATEFTTADDPRLVLTAARKIQSVRKDIDDATCTALQRECIGFMAEPATARKHINDAVDQAVATERPSDALLSEIGIYKRGVRRGLCEYLVKMLPSQAPLMESLREAMDNPKTMAGNRDLLCEQAAGLFAEQPPQWDDENTMPDWARGSAPPPADPGPPGIPPEPPPDAQLPLEELRPELRHLLGLLALLRSSGPPESLSRSTNDQIGILIDYDKMLASGRDFAVTTKGIPLTAGEARAAVCNASLYPLVLGGKSKILDLGRAQRLFSKAQVRALRAVFRGCGYPGCTMPASRCEADHLDKWERGGKTDIDRAGLWCEVHHIARHCGLFHAVIVPNSRPLVLLPRELNPSQKLQVNTYFMTPSEAREAQEQAAMATRAWRDGTVEVEIIDP
ncbi:HNH endonuclease signature motif containing protein [Glutamicibacter sp.]|uniref:HNH endonuclease signature motif containing protein n=1 Tax=Glutamicibacter sp. TaxID=1931995 RepID=UPI0028BE6F99|nr:HNH endonuclease signature motif containing protein [Glutamicibacter sp.]